VELDEQMHNKFTSLKSLFKSTDPSKHFHGVKIKKFTSAKDQPDPSHAQLTSKSNSTDVPASMGFKDKLLSHYKENFAGMHTDKKTGLNVRGGRIYHNAQTANYATSGIHLYGRGTNSQIKKLDNKFAKREREITGNDSVRHARSALMYDVNREHERNYEIKHHQQPHPAPQDPRLTQHKLPPNPILAKISPKKPASPVAHNPAMHDPQALLHKQNSFANQAPHAHNPTEHPISSHPSNSPSHPIPVHPVQPKFHRNK
jgi:hypothetical protein